MGKRSFMRKINNDNIKRVVLTGGPKGGKSSMIPYVKEIAEERGIKVLIASEAATARIIGGISPASVGMIPFQEYVIELQMLDYAHMEKAAESLLQEDKEARILIIYDRGFLDEEAYVGEKEFLRLLDKYNLNRVVAGVEAYDLVVDMVTVGYGLPELFDNTNNEARYESTAEEACLLEDKIQRAWMDFEHFEIFSNRTDFETKLKKATSAILNLFDEPPIENERKFLLLDYINIARLPKNTRSVDISQTYLKTEFGAERVRKRKVDDINSFYWTKKYQTSAGLAEKQRLISEDSYSSFLERKVGEELRKKRFCFAHDHVRMELDLFSNVFLGDISGYEFMNDTPLHLLEIEGLDVDNVTIPHYIGLYKEVTGDKRFSNSKLAYIAR